MWSNNSANFEWTLTREKKRGVAKTSIAKRVGKCLSLFDWMEERWSIHENYGTCLLLLSHKRPPWKWLTRIMYNMKCYGSWWGKIGLPIQYSCVCFRNRCVPQYVHLNIQFVASIEPSYDGIGRKKNTFMRIQTHAIYKLLLKRKTHQGQLGFVVSLLITRVLYEPQNPHLWYSQWNCEVPFRSQSWQSMSWVRSLYSSGSCSAASNASSIPK